jgi:hypothetical protein
LLLQRDAGIEHHAQQADDLQFAVEVGVHLLDGVDQIGQAFEREILALHRHDHAVRRAKAVEGEHAQGRRAVDEHEVVVGVHLGQAVFRRFSRAPAHQLDLGARQLAVGAQHVVAALLRQHGRFADRGGFQQHVVHAQRQLALVHARAHGRVALRVQVDHQHALPHLGQARGEVDGGGGLADAALLVGNAKNFGHGCLRVRGG